MAFQLYKDGAFEIDKKPGTINQLTGRFAFYFSNRSIQQLLTL